MKVRVPSRLHERRLPTPVSTKWVGLETLVRLLKSSAFRQLTLIPILNCIQRLDSLAAELRDYCHSNFAEKSN